MIWAGPQEARAVSDTPVFEPMFSTVLTYHKIGAHKEFGITTVGRERFAGHLDLLLGLGYNMVSASRAASGTVGGMGLAVTFDDGYESVYLDALPEMLARGVAGTVFQVVGSVGGRNEWDVNLAPRRVMHLSWRQIKELVEAGFEIGSHTVTHRDLTKLAPRELARELGDSKRTIEDKTGARVVAISYPFGRYSRRVIDETVEAGYTCGFTSFPNSRGDRMTVGRWGVYSIDGPGALKRKLGLRPGRGLERLKNMVIARLSLGTTLVKR
jgi:peptidoglycan/xylan/chitin deacetylase (PgdA/CDA1 family)